MKKYWKIGIAGAAVVAGLLVGIKIHAVNTETKDVPEEIYEMGQDVSLDQCVLFSYPMDGYSIKVKNARVLDTENFLKEYHAVGKNIPELYYEPQIYEVEVEISNKDNEESGINLRELYLQDNAGLIGFNEVYYRIANKEKGYEETGIAVRPGTSITMLLEFSIPEKNFSKKACKNMEGEDFKLVATLYPVKKMIKLK